MTVTGLNALIVDPDRNRRQQLHYMLKVTEGYSQIDFVCDSAETVKRFSDSGVNYDVLFFVSREPASSRTLIEAVQALAGGMHTIFVALINSTGQSLSEEEAVLIGAHGSLCEPFSVEDIQSQTSVTLI